MINSNLYDHTPNEDMSYFFKCQYLKRSFLCDFNIIDDSIKKYMIYFPRLITENFCIDCRPLAFYDIADRYFELGKKIILYNFRSEFEKLKNYSNLNYIELVCLLGGENIAKTVDRTIDYLQNIFLTNLEAIINFKKYTINLCCSGVYEYHPDDEDKISLFLFLITSCKYWQMVSELIAPPSMDEYIRCYISGQKLHFFRKLHDQFDDLNKYINGNLSAQIRNILIAILEGRVDKYESKKISNFRSSIMKIKNAHIDFRSFKKRFVGLWVFDRLNFTESNKDRNDLIVDAYQLYPKLFEKDKKNKTDSSVVEHYDVTDPSDRGQFSKYIITTENAVLSRGKELQYKPKRKNSEKNNNPEGFYDFSFFDKY